LFDKEKKSTLTKEALITVMKAHGHYMSEEEAESMLNEVDCDGSYEVDIYEFIAMLTRCCLEHRYKSGESDDSCKLRDLKEIFHQFDKNGDNKLEF